MNLETAKRFISEMGWSPVERARRKGKLYLYARKRDKSQIKERYIAPLSQIEEMSKEQVLEKLNK